MRKTVVVNSTPILALTGIGHINILKELYDTVIIPNAVHDEVTVKDKYALNDYDWICVKSIFNLTLKEMFTSALHDGEVEVMLLAKELGADLVIIDDGLARRHAKYLGLTVTGTIGVLLRAKDIKIINEVKPILDELIKNGFYISGNIYNEILRLSGELTI